VRPGRAADHSLPSSAAVMEEYSYTSTHPLGHTGPVTGSLSLYLLLLLLLLLYYYYYCLLQLSFHLVAVDITLVTNKNKYT